MRNARRPALANTLNQTSISYDAAYLSQLRASTNAPKPPTPQDEEMTFDQSELDGALIIDHPSFPQPDESASIIPSESSIKAAKEKRLRLKRPEESEFISLTVSKRGEGEGEGHGPHPMSRLMREDDELGDAEEGTPYSLPPILLIGC